MHWLVCRCHQGGKLPWPTPSTLPSPPQCSHWHLQSISFILKRHRSHSKGNFWRDLFGKDVLKWNIEAGPLPGTHSRNRQPVSGASAPRPFFCPPAPLSNNYSTHRYSPFNQCFDCLYVDGTLEIHACAPSYNSLESAKGRKAVGKLEA